MQTGIFITFEGIEGSGKSTHARLAAEFLQSLGKEVVLLREPGCTRISEQIRDVLLDKKNSEMTVACELLLYNAARAQLVDEIIRPALERGAVVICDRFYDSTVAYQCFGGEMDREIADCINTFAAQGLVPQKSFLLDSDVERGLERAGRGDRMELKSLAFHKRVRDGFLTIARESHERFILIDEMSIDEGRVIINKELERIVS